MKIRFASDRDLISLKNLWYECFSEHDSKASIDHYFKTKYDHRNSLLLVNEHEEILCSLQMNPHELAIQDSRIPVRFFIGVATPTQHRRKGYMKILMEEALRYLKEDLHQELCILQAYDWNVYESFGFEVHYYKKEVNVVGTATNLPKKACKQDITHLLDLYQTYANHFDGTALRNHHYYDVLFDSFKIEDVSCYFGSDYYYLMTTQGHETLVLEFIYLPSFDFSTLPSLFTQEVVLQIDLHSPLEGKESPYMAIKPLNDSLYLKYPTLRDKKRLFISEQI